MPGNRRQMHSRISPERELDELLMGSEQDEAADTSSCRQFLDEQLKETELDEQG